MFVILKDWKAWNLCGEDLKAFERREQTLATTLLPKSLSTIQPDSIEKS